MQQEQNGQNRFKQVNQVGFVDFPLRHKGDSLKGLCLVPYGIFFPMEKKGYVLIPVSHCKCSLCIMGMDSWGDSRKSINDWSDRAGGFFLLRLLGCFSSFDLAFRPFRFIWAQLSTICHTSKTTFRLAASASLHAPFFNAQLMSGYVTFFLSALELFHNPWAMLLRARLACQFWRKYSWEQQGRTGTALFTSPCGLFQAGKLALASVSREL